MSRARAVARAVSAVHHALAGPLQATLNTMFVLRKGNETDARLQQVEQQLVLLRSKLAAFGAIAEVVRPIARSLVRSTAIVDGALAAVREPARVVTEIEDCELYVDATLSIHALVAILECALGLSDGTVALAMRVERAAVFDVRSDVEWPTVLDGTDDDVLIATDASTLGLDWTVAAAVAEAHGGSLEIDRGTDARLVTMRLPLS